MRTLKDNYQKNVDILKENIKRGMSKDQANIAINNMQNSFLMARLYDEDAQDFIKTMKNIVKDEFTTEITAAKAMENLGINVVHIK